MEAVTRRSAGPNRFETIVRDSMKCRESNRSLIPVRRLISSKLNLICKTGQLETLLKLEISLLIELIINL